MKPPVFLAVLAAVVFAAASARAQPAPQYSDEQTWAMQLQKEIPDDELSAAASDAESQSTDDPLLALAAKHAITAPDWLQKRIAAQGSSTILAGLGDSITAAFASCSFPFYYCPDNSWSTGSLSTTVRTQLAAQSGRDVRYFLVAVPGTTMSFMPTEAYAVFLASSFGLRIERMTLFIGHNDPGVCGAPNDHMTQDFGDKYAKTLSILNHVASKRGAKLFVSSITEVPTLARYGDVIPSGSQKTCRQLWTDIGRCAPLLGAGAPPDAGQKISAQIATYDALLAKLAEGRSWVLYTDSINASSREGLTDPARELSSYDCFHPSALGQGMLGQIAWHGFGGAPGIASFFAFPKADEPVARPAPVLPEETAAELDSWRSEVQRP